MLCHTVYRYTLLVAGLASQTLAGFRREPYQPKLVHMAAADVIGIYRRAIEGYAPIQQLCGEGDTCAEACGSGFEQCASGDGMAHCYNPLNKQTCCPSGRGDSCDDGYFCTADDNGKTWCCPEGLSLTDCARKYGIPGPLSSQGPSVSSPITTTDTGAAGTAAASTTQQTSDTTGTKSTDTETIENASTTETDDGSTSNSQLETSTATPSQSSGTIAVDTSIISTPTEATATQTTALASIPSTPSTPSTPSSTSSSGSRGPVNNIVLCVAGVLAALF